MDNTEADQSVNKTTTRMASRFEYFPFADLMFSVLLTFSIIFLNSFVLILIFKIGSKKLMKNAFNIQILSLCISDFLVGLTLIPLQFSYFYENVPHLGCTIICGTFLIAFMASILHICEICVDRWWLISTNRNNTYSIQRCCKLVISTWLCAFILEFIPLALWRSDQDYETCSIFSIFGKYHTYAMEYLACTSIFVLVCIFLFYGLIILFIFKTKRTRTLQSRINIHSSSGVGAIQTISQNSLNITARDLAPVQNFAIQASPCQSSSSNFTVTGPFARNTETKAIKAIGLILTIHLLCLGPLVITQMLEFSDLFPPPTVSWYQTLFCIACISSAGNPILYAFRIPEIQGTLKQIFERNRVEPQV